MLNELRERTILGIVEDIRTREGSTKVLQTIVQNKVKLKPLKGKPSS